MKQDFQDVKLYDDETIDDLQLNGLNIIQKNKNFRFGIDAVLLSNFANVKSKYRVVDLCTGTGIVPLLLLGKYNIQEAVGIEIQEHMAEMANRSMQLNNCDKIIKIYNKDLKDIEFLKSIGKFDVLTVNPPYKLAQSGIVNEADELAIARHEIKCTIEDVVAAAKVLLKDNGRMFMVHRPERLIDVIEAMRKYRIEPKRIQMVHPNIKKAPNIMLIEGQNYGGKFLKWDSPLYVYNEDGTYTREINDIYGRGMK